MDTTENPSKHPLAGLDEARVRHELWRRGNLSYKLDSLQLEIRAKIRGRKKVAILSSRQIGKSYTSCTIALEYLAQNPGKIARIVAPTLKQCNDIVADNLLPISQDAPKGWLERVKSEYRWVLANGGSLRLGALERQYVDGNRGGNASLIIYEECGFVSADDFSYGVDSVLGPQLLRSEGGCEIFVSSPSEDPEHPLHTRIMPEAEADGASFRFTVFDSPSISPVKILEAMRRSGCRVTDLFRAAILQGIVTSQNVLEIAIVTDTLLSEAFLREYLAMIIRPQRLMVVPGYDEARHVAEFHLPDGYLQVTADWGGVRDMTVALAHIYDYVADKVLIWDERWWQPNTPTATIVRDLVAWEASMPSLYARTADVHGQTQVDLIDLGYEVQMPQKNDWLSSVQSMATEFATDRILIHPRCDILRRTCKAGLLNKNRTDFERIPGLGHCDALAALMYGLRAQNRTPPMPVEIRNDEFTFAMKEAEKPLAELKMWGAGPKSFGSFRKHG